MHGTSKSRVVFPLVLLAAKAWCAASFLSGGAPNVHQPCDDMLPSGARLAPCDSHVDPLRMFRDTYEHAVHPDKFIADRVQRLGPVFQSHCLLRHAVFIGGEAAVHDFIKLDRELSMVAPRDMLSKPLMSLLASEAPFLGQQVGQVHKLERRVTQTALQGGMLQRTLPRILEDRLEYFFSNLKKQKADKTNSMHTHSSGDGYRPIDLTRDVTECCTDIISFYLTGCEEPLSRKEHSHLKDITQGILTISRVDPRYGRAQKAKRFMQKSILRRVQTAAARTSASPIELERETPNAPPTLSMGALPQFQRLANTAQGERMFGGTMTNTALTETFLQSFLAGDLVGALIANAICFLGCNPEMVSALYTEACTNNSNDTEHNGGFARSSAHRSPYAKGVVRETLRMMTITQLSTRLVTPRAVTIAGYHIPKNTLLIVEPRIGNKHAPAQFPDGDTFEPMRWVDPLNFGGSSEDFTRRRCPVTGQASKYQTSSPSWIPGGAGNHACPGMDLSEHIAVGFLQAWVKQFRYWRPICQRHDMAKPPLRKATSIAPGPEFQIQVRGR